MNLVKPQAKDFTSFAELTQHYVRDVDYQVRTRIDLNSQVAIIAPHAGDIENMTSEITDYICEDQFSYYLFEGMLPPPYSGYQCLHLTSTRFDDPVCLDLIADCPVVVSIHGCKGNVPEVLLGGLDDELKARLADGLRDAGVPVRTERHAFPGIHPHNICNRGASGKGVQLEFSDGLRNADIDLLMCAARTIRTTLRSVDGTR